MKIRSDQATSSSSEDVESTEEKSGQDDFIPTGPTTSRDSLEQDENESSSGHDAGFELDTDALQSPYAPPLDGESDGKTTAILWNLMARIRTILMILTTN
ncbi:MAG: hypothetical protein U5J63_09900 [Fodinibius sp.]|nr:hypothetical protein [Fodinibius sp.]